MTGLPFVHHTAIVGSNVRLNGGVVHEYAVLGHPTNFPYTLPGERLNIGANAVIRPFTVIYAPNEIGDRFRTGQGVSIRERNVIGNDVSVGTHTSIEFGNVIGNRVNIHSGCFLELVTLEDDVFVGPNVVFTDDPHPRCPAYLQCVRGATVKRRARIGANSTILPGVHIGEDALIGAGSVVYERHIPARSVWAGNPAVQIREDITQLDCFAGIYTHAYAWQDPKRKE